MKILTVTALLLAFLSGCGQTGPLQPAQAPPQSDEADE